jgi:hypothetical protein
LTPSAAFILLRRAGGTLAKGITKAPNWTVVTYLPFLLGPETHMFLKPKVTKDFAARMGHGFASDYEPHLPTPAIA